MTIVGFDFGTTNSLVSIIQGGKAVNFLSKEGLPFPSMVCYEGSKVIVGQDARQRLAGAGLGVQGNVVRSPKRLLGRETVSIDDIERNPADIVADVVRYIRNTVATDKKKHLVVDNAVVTIPVDMKGYQRAALRDAFRIAGIGIFQFIHEPLAALYGHLRSTEDYAARLRQYDRQLILVFDWGGGTLDLTLCRLIDGHLFQITNDGTDEVGGDVFDEQLRNEIIKRVMIARGLNEDVMIDYNAKMRLLHACERAKIDLSTKPKTTIFVSNFFKGFDDSDLADLDYQLTRDELEELVSPILNKGLHRIQRLLENADVLPMGLALCLVTGGMSNMPAIKARLHQIFGPQRVQVSDRNTTLIAEGAAWAAHDQAQLILAKNVELLLARNSRISLLKAGLPMPREGEIKKTDFHLYCVDPRDGVAKFQLESPIRPGAQVLNNDVRVPLDNLTVKVDAKAQPFRERLELELQIDDNLILQAQARSLNQKDLAKVQVHMLEFGLVLPGNHPAKEFKDESTKVVGSSLPHKKGSLALRSNIASEKKEIFVPGELLYQTNPNYFDVRLNPPPIQDEERLYYEPCSVCRRASNDPLCRCASTAPRNTIRGKFSQQVGDRR